MKRSRKRQKGRKKMFKKLGFPPKKPGRNRSPWSPMRKASALNAGHKGQP